jgi:hypothetical protein
VGQGPRVHTGENFQILSVEKIIQTYGRQKNVVCNSLVKYLFLLGGLRTHFARAANFPSRRKSITLLTCCIIVIYADHALNFNSRIFTWENNFH